LFRHGERSVWTRERKIKKCNSKISNKREKEISLFSQTLSSEQLVDLGGKEAIVLKE
jgi:hypothetical protein